MPNEDREYLKPAEGLKVRRPDTNKHLAPEGDWVEMNTFWRRRLRDGDVARATPPRRQAAAKAAPATDSTE